MRWQRGEAAIEQLIADGELQTISGDAADGYPWLDKARRTLAAAAKITEVDPASAFTLAYDAARFGCVALLTHQGLRATTAGGHYAVDVAVREQFGEVFRQFGPMRRQRNDIEYPMYVTDTLTPSDAHRAAEAATKMLDAADQLIEHLGRFS